MKTTTITELMVKDHLKIVKLVNSLEDSLGKSTFEIKRTFDSFLWELEKHLFTEEKAIFTQYESDDVILAIAARQAQVYEKFGMDVRLDQILDQQLTTTVNMGQNATDPVMKVNKLVFAARNIAEIAANPTPGLNLPELFKEIFGSLGYKDGARFYQAGPDPQQMQMQQVIEQMQAQIQQLTAALQDREKDRQLALEISERERQAKIAQKQMDVEAKMAAKQADIQAKQTDLGVKGGMQEKDISAEMIKTRYQEQQENRRLEDKLKVDLLKESMRQADAVIVRGQPTVRDNGAGRTGPGVY